MNHSEKYPDFKEKYVEWKNKGLTDREISLMLFVSRDVITQLKKFYGVSFDKMIRKNRQGLTEEQLKIADKKGISRRLALRRVREYGWEIQDAIHTPKGLWCGNYGGTMQEREEKKRRKQREYYEMRKRKVLR